MYKLFKSCKAENNKHFSLSKLINGFNSISIKTPAIHFVDIIDMIQNLYGKAKELELLNFLDKE